MYKLDVGCGIYKQEGFIGLDKYKVKGVDIVADAEVNIPLENNSVDEIYCKDTLEHMDNYINALKEFYRVCKKGAVITIIVPYYTSRTAFSDPSHKHRFTEETFKYFEKEHYFNYFLKTDFNFEIIEQNLIYNQHGSVKYLPFKKYLSYFLNNIIEKIEVKLEVIK